MKRKRRNNSRSGNVLPMVLVLTIVAVATTGSIIKLLGSYARINRGAEQLDYAFFLADAGIQAALNEIQNGANGGDGMITEGESRALFAFTDRLPAGTSSWHFSTTATVINAAEMEIVSVGTYLEKTKTVRARLTQTEGADTIHAVFSHAIYAGNSSEDPWHEFTFGGANSDADRISGDVYVHGDVYRSGDAVLPNPEEYEDVNENGMWTPKEGYVDSHVILKDGVTNTYPQVFTGAVTEDELVQYQDDVDFSRTYVNGTYDLGEAFVDTIGNGVYDPGENLLVDVNGNGIYDHGDAFQDADGDGEWDPGEQFVDNGNGIYDTGESFEDMNGNGVWDAGTDGYYETVRRGWRRYRRWVPGSPPEPFEDVGNGVFDEGESFVDQNGVYDPGEDFVDDRNGVYDYGTTVTGDLMGMTPPAPGQYQADGNDEKISPPELDRMYYHVPRGASVPASAFDNYGYDVNVAAAFSAPGQVTVTDQGDPAHIFVKNPPVSGGSVAGVPARTYTPMTDANGARIKDDYFIEDITDSSYGNSHQYITISEEGNSKVYYVDGNVYIHNPQTYDFKFRNEGQKITIVANGNITLSDEFWYNGGTEDPQDSLVLIAMKDPTVTNYATGNIYLGDAQFGTGGDMHAMLFAENNFVDNNLNSGNQSHLSVFGNMSAGNKLDIARDFDDPNNTRLNVTLDTRIRDGGKSSGIVGLPPATGGEQAIVIEEKWTLKKGSWALFTGLE